MFIYHLSIHYIELLLEMSGCTIPQIVYDRDVWYIPKSISLSLTNLSLVPKHSMISQYCRANQEWQWRRVLFIIVK